MSDIASNDGWSEADSENFIDYGRYYVPEREQQIETICSLIPDTPPPSHVVELCCGEGLLSHALLERLPNATVHAFDGSPKCWRIRARGWRNSAIASTPPNSTSPPATGAPFPGP